MHFFSLYKEFGAVSICKFEILENTAYETAGDKPPPYGMMVFLGNSLQDRSGVNLQI